MIEYRPDGVVTDDPVIASLFLACRTKEPRWPDTDWVSLDMVSDDCWGWWNEGAFEPEDYPILIPYAEIQRVIEPVEGEGCVYDSLIRESVESPLRIVVYKGSQTSDVKFPSDIWYHKRVLLFVTTRAELRELIQRIEEEGK